MFYLKPNDYTRIEIPIKTFSLPVLNVEKNSMLTLWSCFSIQTDSTCMARKYTALHAPND